ncbi:MAG: carbohydrate deacetylase [Myxococcaceae bacterium]
MIRLVVNADDLGLHPSIDEGILRAHREGIVTSASLLVTGPNAPAAVSAANAQGLAMGVHLCLSTALSCAAPPEEVPTVAPGGKFRAKWPDAVRAYATGVLKRREVARELRAQVERARALGADVDHLDAHQHLHVLPGIRTTVEELAEETGLPLRWPRERPHRSWLRTPDAAAKSLILSALGLLPTRSHARKVPAAGIFEAGALDFAALSALLNALPEGDHEIGCHPGAATVHVPEDPTWTYGWTQELTALTDPRAKALIASRGIELTTYRALYPHLQ